MNVDDVAALLRQKARGKQLSAVRKMYATPYGVARVTDLGTSGRGGQVAEALIRLGVAQRWTGADIMLTDFGWAVARKVTNT